MKRIYRIFAFAAVAAAAIIACNKSMEVSTPAEEQEHIYTFTIGDDEDMSKAVLASDANGRFAQWESGDKLGSITTETSGYSNITPADENNPAFFSIYSKGGLAEGNTITVWYPYGGSTQSDATAVSLVIPAEQHHLSDGRFDFDAMPMVAKQITVTSAMVSSINQTPLSTIYFANLGSVLNFRVFSTKEEYASEKVKTITFNANSNIGGTFTKNLATINPDEETPETMTIDSFSDGVNSIVTSPYADASIGTSKANALYLYMVVAPGTYTGSIVVNTDKAEYTYELSSSKTFVRSGIKAFGLDLNSENVSRVEAEVVDYVSLPWNYEGGTSSDLNAVVGVTTGGLGSDYAELNAPYRVKFDTTGDYIQVKTNTIIDEVSVGYKMLGGNTTSYLNIFESADGSDWGERIDRLEISGSLNSTGEVTTTSLFNVNSRYVRIVFEKGSNVGIGGISITDGVNWNLSSIEVTNEPEKTSYEAGENFDPSGMVVTAHYVDADDNTHTKDVVLNNAVLTITPSTSLTAETENVTISYGGKSTTQAITVNAAKVWDLKSIEVTIAPTKTTYIEGEYFDPTDLVVTATFEEHGNTSNTKEEIVDNDDLTFDPSTSTALTTSNVSVTISYTVSGITKTTTQEITVNAASAIVYYEKVTSAPTDWSGDYLIVYEASSTSGEVLTGVSSNIGQHTTVVISDSKIIASDYEDYNVTIEQSGGSYTMKLGNKYLAYTSTTTSGSNNLYAVDNVSTNGTLWTLSIDDAHNVYNTSRYLRYNTGSPRFCCYTSGQEKISFYKLQDNTVWDLKSISVTTPPTKTIYEVGENFDPTGMVVRATYGDHDGVKADKIETIANSDLEFSPALDAELTTADDEITISYGGLSTTQEISVIAWDLKSIAVTTPPTNTAYTEGEFFNPAGMVVTATFENHNNTEQTKQETVVNANLTFTPALDVALTTGDISVGISYTVGGLTKSTTQSITVSPLAATYTLNLTSDEHGTVTATVDEVAVTSGGSVEVGKTVTITATPTDGYQLSSLVYNDGADHNITSIKYFIMPSRNVTVTASFEAITSTTKLTNANIVDAGSAASGYASYELQDDNGNEYSAYAIKNQHSNATSSYHFLQIKKYASNTAYYIQIPELGNKITSIKMTVSNTSQPMTGGNNSATLYFSAYSSTSSTGSGVASGTGASSVTIDCSSLNLNTGYITASGAVRVWDIEITYE